MAILKYISVFRPTRHFRTGLSSIVSKIIAKYTMMSVVLPRYLFSALTVYFSLFIFRKKFPCSNEVPGNAVQVSFMTVSVARTLAIILTRLTIAEDTLLVYISNQRRMGRIQVIAINSVINHLFSKKDSRTNGRYSAEMICVALTTLISRRCVCERVFQTIGMTSVTQMVCSSFTAHPCQESYKISRCLRAEHCKLYLLAEVYSNIFCPE